MSFGTGAMKGWWGPYKNYEAQQGCFHGNPLSAEPALQVVTKQHHSTDGMPEETLT